ncbi:LOW QUALITY PROTEIN: solute carrier family 2 member 9, like 1 [Lates calcarifer]|uniref:Solute carrier family 2, facilitated glucose transporter member 5 n=1 Tax=Lates calcarifer TaxID=8187 RepID=A0AAJ8BDE2_LATCA|nr:LOW QUALITY PROTEIN: solute carrier family 2 member 9, like 1 [Lates calcarifer]
MYCTVHTSEDKMDTLLQQLTRGNALFLIIILGMGGSFQSGYHITGLSSPSPYIQRFINSSWYERHKEPPPAHTVTMIWSLIVSMYAVGGFFGAISVKFFSGRLGRKKAMIGNSVIAIVAAGIMLTSKRANSFEMIIVARILFGFSVGLGTSTHLMYLGEISPRKIRGAVTLTLATFMSLGKLSGQFFGLSEILGREELWDIVLCVPACFSVVHVIVLPFLPEAPRYLFIEKGDDKACKKALQSLWGTGDYKQEMDEMLIEQAAIEAAPPKNPLQLLRDRTVRWQLITMSLIYCCNQLSGMSAISTFSFDIFLKVGIPRDKIRYVTLGLGVSEIITSISCGLLIEFTGRRPLFWGAYGVMSALLVLVTVTLNLKDSSYWVPYITAGLIILFIIFFCGGPAGASATLNSEIFIQSDRLAALVLMGIQRWLLFAVLGLVFPFLINGLSTYCFVLFACVCLLGCFYTFFLLPETKGKTLLEISEEFKAITLCGKSFSETERVETKL